MEVDYAVGDLVWIRTPDSTKLSPRWSGPYSVVDVKNANVIVVDGTPPKTYNVDVVKPCLSIPRGCVPVPIACDPPSSSSSSTSQNADEPELSVGEVLKHRVRPDGSLQWLVRWAGPNAPPP